MLDTATFPARKVEILFRGGSLDNIIDSIIDADKLSAQYVTQIAPPLRSLSVRETCRQVWEYWKNLVPYVEDPPGKQIIQSPGEVYRNRKTSLGGTGKGCDCKSFSIAVAACLQVLGILYLYRFIAEDEGDELHHVYIVADGGIILDCVYDYFDQEVPHDVQVDVAPDGNVRISGISATQAPAISLSSIGSLDDSGQTRDWTPALVVMAGLAMKFV